MLNLNLPSDQSTNSNFLYQSLGSFWNQLFSEKGTLQGYTIGESEELLQAYQNIVETVYSFGVNDCPVYHKEIWQPLVILKSQLNKSPFLFEPNGAVFGPQPSNDPFYANQIFQFGFPKSPTQFVYSYTPPFTIGNFSLIANNIYSPSNYYFEGVDVQLQSGVLFFNKNPFDNPLNTVINIIGTNGVPVTYVDNNGITQNDQQLILWLYNVNLDENNLYNNFGYVFKINQPTSEEYKNVLRGFFTISAGGANVLALKNLLTYIGGIVPVIDNQETVQYVSTNEYNQVVVTNSHSYLFNLSESLLPSVIPGAVFYAGDTFTNLFAYYDSLNKNWWSTVFPSSNAVPFSSYLFLGNYQYQLLFPNSIQLITLSPSGVLNFPVEGLSSDVQIFQDYINIEANKAQIIEALGLTQSSNPDNNLVTYPINPVDFLFENFLKNNTAAIVLNFSSPDQTAAFLTLFDEMKQYLPKHVYFMLVLNVSLGTEIYDNLNNCVNVGGVNYNADSSLSTGRASNSSPVGYFKISKSPLAGGHGLIQPQNIQNVRCNSWWGNSGTAYCKSGRVFTQIPSGATTATVKTLRIIDLS